jgi:hypothetical protein
MFKENREAEASPTLAKIESEIPSHPNAVMLNPVLSLTQYRFSIWTERK